MVKNDMIKQRRRDIICLEVLLNCAFFIVAIGRTAHEHLINNNYCCCPLDSTKMLIK